LGIAFQIADDVLDLKGDAYVVGKTLGTDLHQQKLTLPLIRALAELSGDDAERLRGVLRNRAVAETVDSLATTGAIESVEAEARRIATTARRALAALPASPYRTALEQIADWAVKRSN